MFRRTHRHHGARRGRPSRFWTTARRATLAEIVATENQRTATAALMRPRPRLARGLCRSRVHRQLRTSPRVAGQMQREPFGTPRVPKRLYFHLNSCQYGSFERQLGPAGFLPAPLCFSYLRPWSLAAPPGLAGRRPATFFGQTGQFWASSQHRTTHDDGASVLLSRSSRDAARSPPSFFYAFGAFGASPAPPAPFRRLRRRFFSFFPSFFLFFWSLPA